MKIKLPDDPRSARMLEALDDRYFQFAEGLPPPLKDAALLERTILGHPVDGPFRGPVKMNALITCTPWLFWELFSGLEDDIFLTVGEAGMFLGLSSVVLDHLVDGQTENPELMALFQRAFHNRSVSCLRKVFPSSSAFWDQYERLTREYLKSLGAEVETQSSPNLLTLENFREFAGGKVSPMVITIAALAEASDMFSVLEPIETSLRHSYIAGQIHDDILDWPSDLENRHLTFFLSRLASPDTWRGEEWPTVDEGYDVNNQEWLDVEYFGLVIEHFDLCIEAVEGIQCAAWIHYLEEYRGIAEEHQKSATASHLMRTLESVIQPSGE